MFFQSQNKTQKMSASANAASSCFENLIGLRGGTCDEVVPTSGLFFNDTGISVGELNEYATEEYKNGTDLFLKKLKSSIDTVANRVHTSLLPNYRAKSVVENIRVGFYQDNLNQIAGITDTFRLLQCELLNSDSYVDFFLNELSLQVDYTGNIDVSVFDLLTGKLIDTITVPCTPNEISTVFPARRYQSRRHKLNLIFAYDSTNISSNTAWATRTGCSNCAGGRRYYTNQHIRITPGKMEITAAKIDKNIVATSDTGGMSMVYSLSCNHTEWLCSIQNVIALPVMYHTAAAIMEHAVYVVPLEQMTPRTQSSHILFARMNEYRSKFETSFAALMQNIKLPSDSKCFECNKRIRTTFMIPS